jgi:hypothetical protein
MLFVSHSAFPKIANGEAGTNYYPVEFSILDSYAIRQL